MTIKTRRRSTLTRREFLKTAAGAGAGLVAVAAIGHARAAVAAVPRGKQEIVMGIGTDVVTMDTRVMMSVPAESQILHVEEPLVFASNDGKQINVLSVAWEPSTNPPGWRVRLRPGIKFDNGEPFDAKSVKVTVESITAEANKSWVAGEPRTLLSSIKEVKVEDDLTVFLRTEPFFRALPINTYLRAMLPPKLAAEKGKEFGVTPSGTGHYRFVEYRSKSHLHLEAKPDYHGFWDGPAKNSTLTFRFLPENATRVAALEAGEVHIIDNLPPDVASRIKRNPNLEVVTSPTNRIMGMYFHGGRPPFNNLKARLAVTHAIDREAIVSKIMGGMTEVVNQPFPPGTLGVAGEKFVPYAYDLKKAKQYFAEAGLTNGTKIKLGGPVGRYTNDRQVVTAVAGMLADVGLDPQMEQLEWGSFWSKATPGYYDLFYVGWTTRGYDPVDFKAVYAGWSDDNAGATHFVEHNKRVVELYELANKTTSHQEAERHYKELAHLLWDNVPQTFLFYEPNIFGINKKLKGYTPRRDTYIYLWGASFD